MPHVGNPGEDCTNPLIEAIAAPALLLSPQTDILAVNRAGLSLLGHDHASDLRGKPLSDCLCPIEASGFLGHLSQIAERPAPLDTAMAAVRGPGGTQLFRANGIKDASGTLQGYLLQQVDPTPHGADFPPSEDERDPLPRRQWELDLTNGEIRMQASGPGLPDITAPSIAEYLRELAPRDVVALHCGITRLASSVEPEFRRNYQLDSPALGRRSIFASGEVYARDENGVPLRITVEEIDVTGISSEGGEVHGLSEGDSRWRSAVQGANQAVWDHDFERDLHFLSKTWRDLRGLGPDDQIPKTTEDWLLTIHPQDVAHLEEDWRRIDAGETDIINYKFRQRHKDGHWVWFLSRGSVVRRDAAGAPVHIIGTDTDITDIKSVELEGQRMSRRLDVAMEAAGMARWEIDPETRSIFWNNHRLIMPELAGGRRGRSFPDWAQRIHPEDREEALAYLGACIDRRCDIAHDYRVLTREGGIRHIRARGKYITDDEAEPRYYGVSFDVTHDKLKTQALEQARARLEYESRHDAMTGLANRRKLDEAYATQASIHRAGSAKRLAVLHFDIDHFKHINDTLGHDAGDATLKHAASVLRRTTPPGALVSRVGGDEFVALLFDAPGDATLERIAEDIIGEISQPFFYGAQECKIGTSIGVATTDYPSADGGQLFINADLALYEAKQAGRGRVRFYSASMKEQARRRKTSFDALSAGFEKGEITCHYQPQFDTETLEVTGLEALVRWQSGKYGMISPQEFLRTAEEMGLIAQCDELVLRRAVHDIKSWTAAGLAVPPVSVNVSANRLNDPTLAESLRAMDLPAGMLTFELLESAFLDARSSVIDQNLRAINALGIDIEIDDFGSGHASIASLLEIAPKRLKIDRNLVQPIVGSQRQKDLVRTIIGIGHMLGIKVVAEGVESDAHIHILREMRCCYLQGFGLARPMDAKTTARFLAERRGASEETMRSLALPAKGKISQQA
ncbi:EAL domain-containing protein [Poseidonocella sedimentorum]|uniref:PAS domain S-box-containing protein/diguanylate cyclase (GGDEF) domain-containing protein n=1 Tax=Poseidonocella sedimentorum TaxID=871652 RepID=A0A1I6DNJ5_9RHOB|nr:EAL domain-containing protein [Poseidonocella sedimentorum]SFR06966.1 PAS domain S-box-containing protein/diguanylate cyclase (GGDEF) domain-containing protein [Poseidonocella sedimentorum]